MAGCITMVKYQGLGNDYLVLDPNKNRVQLQGKKIALMCQRGFGLGADGVLYGPVEINGKTGVHIFNADGSEAAISGNGVRIFAKYLMDQGYVKDMGKRFRLYKSLRYRKLRRSSDRLSSGNGGESCECEPARRNDPDRYY